MDDKRCMMNLKVVLSSCFTCNDQGCQIKIPTQQIACAADEPIWGNPVHSGCSNWFQDRN